MWIKTAQGEHINMDHVARFTFLRGTKENQKDNQLPMVVEYPSGERESLLIYQSTHEDLEELVYNRPVVPSPDGYFLLSYYPAVAGEDSNEETITRWPVLVWLLDLDFGFHRTVTAWTSGKDEDFGNNDAILCPNGRVVRPGDSMWPNEDDWLAEMRQPKAEKAA
jgi:hypothetical protein